MKLIINNQADWNKLQAMANKAIGVKPFQVELKTDYKKRSNNQNAYLHKIFEIVAKANGSSATFWKNAFKYEFGKKTVQIGLDKQPFIVVESTSEYTTAELADFITLITAYCASHLDLQILTPEEFNNGDDK